MAMFENLGHFFKRMVKTEQQKELGSKDAAKERLHLVLMQDRANVSADFLELMKQEIIDVIKKYIVVDEESIDVRLTNQANNDGTNGAPSLYANIPIVNIKNDMMAQKVKEFEGVDFNKEMGIPSVSPEEVEKEIIKALEVIELPENMEKATAKVKEEVEDAEPQEMFEEVDEADDDDVTFDDLLKAAEAAEKQIEDQSKEEIKAEKKESDEETKKSTKKQTKTTSSKGKSTSSKKDSSKTKSTDSKSKSKSTSSKKSTSKAKSTDSKKTSSKEKTAE